MIYLDGQFLPDSSSKLSVFDAAVQHGVGLFETMHAYNGRVFRLESHIERLIHSAKELGVTDRLRMDPLCEAVELTLKQNQLADARVRLTVTGGDLSLLALAKGAIAAPEGSPAPKVPEHRPSIFITATPATAYPDTFFTQGVMAVIADAKANPLDPLAGHKTINYWSRLRSLSHAAALKAGEALWFTVTNHLCGGAVSNAFLVKDGQLLTPIARGEETEGALASPTLPGITRAAIFELAEQLGLTVQRKMLTINDVLGSDELMLTNSSWGVLPIVAVERKPIAAGQPGPITQQLRAELSKMIDRECGIQ